MTEQPVLFTSESQQVVGMWHVPQGVAGPAPAVVFCHGFSGNKSEAHRLFVEMARDLASRGIGALRFDFRGSGDSAGDFIDMTVSGEVADTRAALAFVRERPDVDPSRMALLGLSLGGMVAALTVSQEPKISALVLWNAVAFVERMAERRRTEQAEQQMEEWGCVDQGGWAVGKPFLDELPHLKPLSAIASIDVPVLLVRGEDDDVVQADEMRAYEQALKDAGRSVEKHIVREAGHTFQTLPHKAEAIRVTGDWLANSLKS